MPKAPVFTAGATNCRQLLAAPRLSVDCTAFATAGARYIRDCATADTTSAA